MWTKQRSTRAYRPLAPGVGGTTHPGRPLPLQTARPSNSAPSSGTSHAVGAIASDLGGSVHYWNQP
jgi:hypothetical protein